MLRKFIKWMIRIGRGIILVPHEWLGSVAALERAATLRSFRWMSEVPGGNGMGDLMLAFGTTLQGLRGFFSRSPPDDVPIAELLAGAIMQH
ncbi:unnamed protein product [Boreogadus saida]